MKEQVKDLEITMVVRDLFAPIVRACPAVDHTAVFHREGGVLGFLRLTRELRRTHFDLLFDFQGLLRTGLMAWRAHADRKIGRSDARERAGLFYDEQVPLPPGGRRSHPIEILLQFLPLLGAKAELRGQLQFREIAGLNLDFVLGPARARPIVIFPDSRRPERRWSGFKQLTDLILREDRTRRVVWAGSHYVPDKDAFPAGQFLNLTGNTSVVSLPALVSHASWVVANDSGPLHLAAALGVPVLGIFGPTDPRRHGPYPLLAPTNHVIQAPVGDLRLLPAKEVYARFQRLGSPSHRAVTST
ncbi:lipopolysaccharide heptosyltransferase I [Opitutaceae bacterium]